MIDSELPTSLSFLNITNNPCCWNQEGLFSKLKSFLPNLKDFDWKESTLIKKVESVSDFDIDESDNEDDNEENGMDDEKGNNNGCEKDDLIHSLKDLKSIYSANLSPEEKYASYNDAIKSETYKR